MVNSKYFFKKVNLPDNVKIDKILQYKKKVLLKLKTIKQVK